MYRWLIKQKCRVVSLVNLKGDTIVDALAVVSVYKIFMASELTMAHATIIATIVGLRFGPEVAKRIKGNE